MVNEEEKPTRRTRKELKGLVRDLKDALEHQSKALARESKDSLRFRARYEQAEGELQKARTALLESMRAQADQREELVALRAHVRQPRGPVIIEVPDAAVNEVFVHGRAGNNGVLVVPASVASGGEPAPKPSGAILIGRERDRQIVQEGYDAEHDRGHEQVLMAAAECYLNAGAFGPDSWHDRDGRWIPPGGWPWHWSYWKPSEDPIVNLVKAGALIAAAIDSIQSKES